MKPMVTYFFFMPEFDVELHTSEVSMKRWMHYWFDHVTHRTTSMKDVFTPHNRYNEEYWFSSVIIV